jgi:YHS domain-containing protein
MNKYFNRLPKNRIPVFFKACLGVGLMFFFACNGNPKVEMKSPAFESAATAADSAKPKFTTAMVDNKKDPSCGMPVTAGIADTAHFKGKVYGFCSAECKSIFLKNPDSLSKNAALK